MPSSSHRHPALVLAVLVFTTLTLTKARNDTSCFTMPSSNMRIACGQPGFTKKGIRPFDRRPGNSVRCEGFCANTDACTTFSSNGVICSLYRKDAEATYDPNPISPTKFWSSLCYDCVPLFGQQQQLVAIMLGKKYYIHKPSSDSPIDPRTPVSLVLSPRKADANTFGINSTGAVLTTDSPHRYIAFSASPNKYGTSAIQLETQTRFNSQRSPFSSILNCRNPHHDISKLNCKTRYGTQFYSCTDARYLSLRKNDNIEPDPSCTPIKIRPAYFSCTGCSYKEGRKM